MIKSGTNNLRTELIWIQDNLSPFSINHTQAINWQQVSQLLILLENEYE
jgi:hypothetical protein